MMQEWHELPARQLGQYAGVGTCNLGNWFEREQPEKQPNSTAFADLNVP